MARLSVRLIQEKRDKGIALLNSQTTASRMKSMKYLLSVQPIIHSIKQHSEI
jgi:hypothetical protein